MPSEPLSKVYRPQDHEPRIWHQWLESHAFHARPHRVLRGEADPYCVLIPPPNVTAALHLGHALNNTLQDVLVRAHRMKGFETLWMPGTDHAGIATQTVVEKRVLAEEGKRRTDFPRQRFVEKIQAFKDEYEARITAQLKAMGCSCDWARQRFTMDPLCARAVHEAFFQLFKAGLIYRGKRLVNWDPLTQTALADDEVEMEEVDGAFYYLRYPLVHPPENADDPKDAQEVTWNELARRGYPGADAHPEDQPAWITVATTRPETYLGDTGVAVNPKDPRAPAVRDLMVQLPVVGRIIPIVEDDYVVPPARYPWESETQAADRTGGAAADAKALFATGFLKVTPAHDPNDWDIGQRHGLEVINVMAPDASISADHGWNPAERREEAHIFLGKSREDARKLVLKEFAARGLLEDTKPYRHTVGHSYRSHAPVEPYLSDQWYVKVTDDRLRGQAQRALTPDQRSKQSLEAWPDSNPCSDSARPATRETPISVTGDGSLTFHPARYAKTYETWHDNLRDWCISRQLWWGHRIPVWTRSQLAANELDQLQLELQLSEDRSESIAFTKTQDTDGTWTVHLCFRNPSDAAVGLSESHGFTQDPDVLDTWFSSALWPLSTLGWPADDLPLVTAEQIDPDAPPTIVSIFIKRVGTWKNFIGTEGERSGELVDRLLHLRDNAQTATDGRPLTYQLFREADLRALGPQARPLATAENIAEANDLVCAVGLRTLAPLESTKFGTLDLKPWLESHGFQDTAGLLAAFNPTSALCTAREIITLWVSRMVMFNRFFLAQRAAKSLSETQKPTEQDTASLFASAPPPFRDVFIHAMIQDGQGRKMSKSLGNGVDPLDIIESHGADAMRFTLVHMITQTQDVRMPVEPDPKTGKNTSPKFDIGRNFCNKLWNAARFALSNLTTSDELAPPPSSPVAPATLADQWMLSRLADAVDQANKSLASYQFSAYAQTMYDLFWRDFCDWYLEAIKPTVRHLPAQQACLRAVLDAILRLLHPITPFITEAIYEQVRRVPAPPIAGLTLTPSRVGDVLCSAGWPIAEPVLRNDRATQQFERVRELVTAIREVRAQHQVQPKRRITLHADAALADEIAAAEGLVETLAGLEALTTERPGGASVAFTFDAREFRLSNLADAVDDAAERERLARQKSDLEKSIAALKSRLSNPGYTEKAPPHLVEQTRGQLANAESDLATVVAALEKL